VATCGHGLHGSIVLDAKRPCLPSSCSVIALAARSLPHQLHIIATLTYKVLACNQLLYPSHLLTPYTAARTLRSQAKHLLAVPAVSIVIGRRDVSYAAPSLRNGISVKIRNSPSLASCKKRLRHIVSLVPSLSATTPSFP